MPPVKAFVLFGLTRKDVSLPVAWARTLERKLGLNTNQATKLADATGLSSGLSVSTTTTGSTASAGVALTMIVPTTHARAWSRRTFMFVPPLDGSKLILFTP